MADEVGCQVEQVDAAVVVPVNTASDRREHTLRPKLRRHLERYLVDRDTAAVENDAMRLSITGEDPSDPEALLAHLNLDRTIVPADSFRGGTGEAKRVFRRFLDKRFSSYQ